MTSPDLKSSLAVFIYMGLAICFAYPAFLIPDSSPKSAYYVLVLLPGLILIALDFKVFVESLKKNRCMQLVVAMISYWCVTLMWGSDDVVSSQLRRAAVVTIYLFVIWHVFSHYPQYIKPFFIILFSLFCIGCFWGISNLPAVKVLLGGYRLGTKTDFGQAIHAGHYYGAFFCLSMAALLFDKGRPLQTLSAVVCIMAVLAIILAKSRGVYLATAVAVLSTAGLYICLHKKYFMAAVICIVMAGLALAIYYYYPGFILSRGSSYRFEIWTETWRMIQESYWFGIGLGERPAITARGFDHAHSVYLHIWLTTGVVGLLLFLLVVSAAIMRAVKWLSLPYLAGCLVALIFFLVAMATDLQQLINSPNEAWLCFWFCIAYLASVSDRAHVAKLEADNGQPEAAHGVIGLG